MHEVQVPLRHIACASRLYTDVEEADAILELGCDVGCLAADGGEGAVVRVRIMGSGDAEGGEGEGVRDGAHPFCVVGWGVLRVDCKVCCWRSGVVERDVAC